MKPFKGVMTPLLIPFDHEENIIEEELKRHIELLIEEGVNGILSPSSTGEFANLSHVKKEQILRITVESVKKRIPVIALVGECGTRSTVYNIKQAEEIGADAVMATPPYYYPLDQKSIEHHFTVLADEGGMPLWLYHQPGDTKLSINTQTVLSLSNHSNIVGIKISTNDLFYYQRVLRLFQPSDPFSILWGEDHSLLSALILGGDGVVSFLSNIVPKDVITLWNAADKLNIPEGRSRQKRITDCYETLIMVKTGSPQHASKLILKKRGIFTTNVSSSPFLPLDADEELKILQKSEELGLLAEI